MYICAGTELMKLSHGLSSTNNESSTIQLEMFMIFFTYFIPAD